MNKIIAPTAATEPRKPEVFAVVDSITAIEKADEVQPKSTWKNAY